MGFSSLASTGSNKFDDLMDWKLTTTNLLLHYYYYYYYYYS
jgi:hypothetical protein